MPILKPLLSIAHGCSAFLLIPIPSPALHKAADDAARDCEQTSDEGANQRRGKFCGHLFTSKNCGVDLRNRQWMILTCTHCQTFIILFQRQGGRGWPAGCCRVMHGSGYRHKAQGAANIGLARIAVLLDLDGCAVRVRGAMSGRPLPYVLKERRCGRGLGGHSSASMIRSTSSRRIRALRGRRAQ